MRRVNLNDIDRLSYRQGGGWVSLVGLPFLAVGICGIVAALSGKMQTKSGAGWPLGPCLFYVLFVVVGTAIELGRGGIIFDKIAGSVATWWQIICSAANEEP